MTARSRRRAFNGLGSNLCEPRRQVVEGIASLARVAQTSLRRHSRLFQSEPWGLAEQPRFVNAVAEIETALPPRALVEALLAVERDFGRQRSAARWGPRTLDLDLLLYGDCVVDEPGLRVPHPHLQERAFVLLPLAELAPDLEIPELGPIAVLVARIDASTCQLLDPA